MLVKMNKSNPSFVHVSMIKKLSNTLQLLKLFCVIIYESSVNRTDRIMLFVEIYVLSIHHFMTLSIGNDEQTKIIYVGFLNESEIFKYIRHIETLLYSVSLIMCDSQQMKVDWCTAIF